ncbi:Vinorine synthase [Camellia lanceoleosa]|uniref:Vinorine synthase n=1 Tax=Camellia lanceoleosa TaxID=1840588 RepID=A0ACC0GIM2_9ERIC|nr:Vinorine synthase [Camellia lanceoleosa]
MSHKIADGAAYAAFVKAWSDIALGSSETIVPDFIAASSRFPPREDWPVLSMTLVHMTEKIVTKRFVIDASKVATLKAKATSRGVLRRGYHCGPLEMRRDCIPIICPWT